MAVRVADVKVTLAPRCILGSELCGEPGRGEDGMDRVRVIDMEDHPAPVSGGTWLTDEEIDEIGPERERRELVVGAAEDCLLYTSPSPRDS